MGAGIKVGIKGHLAVNYQCLRKMVAFCLDRRFGCWRNVLDGGLDDEYHHCDIIIVANASATRTVTRNALFGSLSN